MANISSQNLPGWLNRHMALWGASLLSLALLLLATTFVWVQYRQRQASEVEHNELYARTLEGHLSLTLNTVSMHLQSMPRSVEGGRIAPGSEAMNGFLNQSLVAMPYVRSFSLLDSEGLILASSSASNIGRRLPLKLLQSRDDRPPNGLGHLLAGRDLSDLTQQGRGLPAQERSIQQFLLPLSLTESTPQGTRYWVAALNPDYFSNYFTIQLGDNEHRAALYNLHGELITINEALALRPGSRANEHIVFKQLLPAQERGSYRAIGLDQQPALGSFRLTRDHALALIIELPQSSVWRHIQDSVQVVALIALVGLALMGALGAMAWRALTAYDTARKDLEAALNELAVKEREQRQLIANVQELMFHTDAQGVLQFINHPEFLGSSHAEALLGLPFESLVDPADQARARGLYRSTAGFLNLPVTLRLAAVNGRKRVLEVSVTPIKREDDLLIGYAGFALDVTEREDARLRLQAQLEFTARLIDVCPIPIFAKDLALRFVMVNQAWTEMTGVEKNLALGRKLSELRPAAQAEPVEARDAQLLSKGGSEHLEVQERERNFLTHRAVYLDASGKPAGVLGSAIDISRFVEAERQIAEARDAAEHANRVKTEFVANMSHELRTPLQSIIGFSELGLGRSGDQPRLQDMFARIHTSGQRMLELVNNLLDLSKLESTIGSLQLSRQDLVPWVKSLVEDMQASADKQSVQLDLQIKAPSLMVRMDGSRLQQALRNVLDNALRFTPANSMVRIQLSREVQDVCIHVHDQGPGIPIGELEQIFEPFHQATGANSSSPNEASPKLSAGFVGGKERAGLGLAVCRNIMTAHGGSVTAHNHPQGGAMFELRLPAA